MTDVTTLLAGIKTRAEGLTDLCSGYLQQGIRHVQRNCDIECSAHDEEDGLYDCNQPDRYDGDRMARALASIPRLVAALEAVAGLHKPFVWDFGFGPVTSCKGCADQGIAEKEAEYPCPTITAVVAALGGGE